MRPPHERATSSGWGAMKTWVMAAGVYGSARWRSGLPARLPDERDEHARPVRPLPPLGPVALHDEQLLLVARAHRDHQPAPLAELLAERIRDLRGGRGDEDPIPRRFVRQSLRPIAGSD